MSDFMVIALIIVLLLLFYNYYYKYSHFNTIAVSSCPTCEKYNVHKLHMDHEEAAKTLEEISKRNTILIEHLRNKYMGKFSPDLESIKNGRIDVIPASQIYSGNSAASEYIQERVSQLISKYSGDKIYEISPLNSSGITSYTQDKETLILCLRRKEKNESGENELHDINTIMFVVLHELAHMMNNTWGHPIEFWVLFKFMLENAVECGIYIPVDYSRNPSRYCGLKLTYSPLFDPNI